MARKSSSRPGRPPALFDPHEIIQEGGSVLNLETEKPIVLRFAEEGDYGEGGVDIRQAWWPDGYEQPAFSNKGIRIPFDTVAQFLMELWGLYGVEQDTILDLLEMALQGSDPESDFHKELTTIHMLLEHS